jgi:hypothetical protein
MKPPAGVNPMVVSSGRPSRIAAMLAPLPRWAMMMREGAAPARVCMMYSNEIP